MAITDSAHSVPRFCINGADLFDHLVTVYINENKPIGQIKDMVIYQHGEDGGMSFSSNDKGFIMDGITVDVSPQGLINLYWSQDFSVEMKALSIAFAVHMALTIKKELCNRPTTAS